MIDVNFWCTTFSQLGRWNLLNRLFSCFLSKTTHYTLFTVTLNITFDIQVLRQNDSCQVNRFTFTPSWTTTKIITMHSQWVADNGCGRPTSNRNIVGLHMLNRRFHVMKNDYSMTETVSNTWQVDNLVDQMCAFLFPCNIILWS